MNAGNVKRASKQSPATRSGGSRAASEEQLRLVKTAAQLGIYDYDIRTGQVHWDERVCELWGGNADEPITSEIFMAAIHPEDRASAQEAVDRALEPNSGGAYSVIHRIINRVDGREHWVQTMGQVIFEQEQPVRLIGTVLDITERKRTELALQQSHRKMSEILESIQDDFYVLDRNWIFVYASRLFTSKVGKAPHDFVGRNIWEMFPKHVDTVFEEHLRAAMEKGEVRRFEIPGKYTNAWYRMTAFPSAEGITVLGRDVSERKQAEQELHEKQAMLQSFYDSVPLLMGIAELDGDTIVAVSANRAAAEFFGAKPEELPGKLGIELSQSEEAEFLWLHKYRQSQENGAPVQFDYEHPHPTGSRWLQTTVTFLGMSTLGRPRFSFVAEEVTARKRRQLNLAFLDELNRDISQLQSVEELMQTVGAKLGARLNLNTCQLVDIDEENDASYIFYVWNASNSQPVYGYYRISEFLTPELYTALRAGNIVTVGDTLNDPRTKAEGYAKTNVLAFITIPFHRNGKWKFLISCTASQVRHWHPDEIELVHEFANRIFPRLERARAEEALRQSEARYRLLHENLRDAFVQVDMDGRILDCNDLYCLMTGYSRDELSTLTYRDLTPERWHAFEQEIVNQQVLTRGFSDIYEKEYRRKDGSVFPVELRAILFRDVTDQPNGMWAIIRDITDRQRAEQALERSEQRLQRALETDAVGVIFFNYDGVVVHANEVFLRMTGYTREQINRRELNWRVMTPPEWIQSSEQQMESFARTGRIGPYEKEYFMADGSRRWMLFAGRDLGDGTISEYCIDISNRKRAEEALRDSEKQLRTLNETLEQRVQEKTGEVRRLASDLVIAVQRERQRISHLLHDDLQQRIYALQMQLKYVRDVLQFRNEPAWHEVVSAETELQDILQLTRQISIDLSPPILPGEGLPHAISWLASQMWQRYGLTVDINANGTFNLSNEELHVLLFNCVRELLFNIVKHADTNQAYVTLQWVDEILQIEVRDAGKGFDPQAPVQQPDPDGLQETFGLPTIRQQLSLFGGYMDVDSTPGKGTRVVFTVPITDSNK